MKQFKVNVTIDRPIGYIDSYQNEYPINYGYIEGIIAQDNEWQDVYLLTDDIISTQVVSANIIAIIVRDDDVEDKWVATTTQTTYSKEDIKKKTNFLEQYFNSSIILLD